jgi:hypothetical protein
LLKNAPHNRGQPRWLWLPVGLFLSHDDDFARRAPHCNGIADIRLPTSAPAKFRENSSVAHHHPPATLYLFSIFPTTGTSRITITHRASRTIPQSTFHLPPSAIHLPHSPLPHSR